MGERATAGGRAVSAFMEGYKAALEDIEQALEDVTCRCQDTHTRDRCIIYRTDLQAVIDGALRGCQPP